MKPKTIMRLYKEYREKYRAMLLMNRALANENEALIAITKGIKADIEPAVFEGVKIDGNTGTDSTNNSNSGSGHDASLPALLPTSDGHVCKDEGC